MAPRPMRGSRAATGGRLFAFVALASFAAVAAALVSQHAYGMEPCPWCVLQRLVFLVMGVVALLGWAWRSATGRRVAATVALLLAACGLASALWQQFVAAKSASCNLTLADRIVSGLQLDSLLPDVFMARASCADAAVDLFGVPYALWAVALFMLCGAAMVQALRKAR